MNVSATDRFSVRHASELYGLDAWGNGYFSIRDNGHLVVAPDRDPARGIDVREIVGRLSERGVHTPVLLRFPQLLAAQIRDLSSCFDKAIAEYQYAADFVPVFPVKVNQQRPVVEGLLKGGSRARLGLEVGSRAELSVAMGLRLPPGSLLVCNGFKDEAYLSAAVLARSIGKNVVVVVEKPFELDRILEFAAAGHRLPDLGFRLRLQARGSGLWEKSGGFAAKFGLTTMQLLQGLERLREAGLADRVRLLHFHIGSQITEIRKVKNAVREGGRVYAKLRKAGVPIRYLDVGGGLGVDYDGSKTSSDASVNYSAQEYANDVVFGLKEVCEEEEVEPPTVVCESGRMMVAYHSILVTDVRAAVSGYDPEPPKLTGREAQVVEDLAEVERNINVKNYREFYHDAIEYRDQTHSLFNLGMLELEDRAKAESLFWRVAGKAVRYSKSAKHVGDEFVDLAAKLHDKYICNFSVFQSLPDHWALDQLFPVIPIHRLNEAPKRRASLVDITCDSDGEVDKFVDLRKLKDSLEVHDLIPGEPYYLGFLLVGAYQDTMGDLHNLFGRVHEAEVVQDSSGRTMVRNLRRGETARDALRCFGFHEEELVEAIDRSLRERVELGEVSAEDAGRILEEYRRGLDDYTYLA